MSTEPADEVIQAIKTFTGTRSIAEALNWLQAAEMTPAPKEPTNLNDALANVINRFSAENGSSTPDFILAEYLVGCLGAFNTAVQKREQWWGRAVPSVSVPVEEARPPMSEAKALDILFRNLAPPSEWELNDIEAGHEAGLEPK